MFIKIYGYVHPSIIQESYQEEKITGQEEGIVYHQGVQYVFTRKTRRKKEVDKVCRHLVNNFAKFPDGSEPCNLVVKFGAWYEIYSSNTCMNARLIQNKVSLKWSG
ncbi:hypothetical protein NDS46_31655 (plasmid) [Paenibacillus thiaminolyticus]|uniref:hypothetical protein n=1 Tax=Paenibacillus thiaminolyticus TaxID=49283 RepID=UPI0023307228|nr:hypothetical protein [Paenibacillus thiaminolyticus]WCF11515.1 hypothetical protein NDS46_31655 [Paenibacillus thiaminolyticus]